MSIQFNPQAPFPKLDAQLPEKVGASKTEGMAHGPSFSEQMKEFIKDVNTTQHASDVATTEFSAGRQSDLHGTLILQEQADIKFRLLASVRNKVIEAYREVMRMGA